MRHDRLNHLHTDRRTRLLNPIHRWKTLTKTFAATYGTINS
jgi:hypothetical protein